MKKILTAIIPFTLMFAILINYALPANAAKKAGKKKGLSQETITEINNGINLLTQKIYEKELYSPEDTNKLITYKIQMDEQMDIMSDAALAPLYFKLGNVFKMRGQQKEAVVCYQTILENFMDTAYGPKSRDILSEMGIEIKLPDANTDEINENEF